MVSGNFPGRYIVGAYATSPNLFSWDENSELVYFNLLKKLPSIRGLELPFWGESLHPFDDQWLLLNLDPNWENVLTCVPGTMKSLETNPRFGLASIDDNSRRKAIHFYRIAFNCINNLKSHFGNKSVIAIYITSAPFVNNNQVYADKENFVLSLIELASWDWGNTKLLIEHCDAYTNKNPNPQKGFLSFIDEIDSAIQVNKKYGSNFSIVINWGRSVIEHRNIDGPLKHLKYAIHNNVLGGLMFSGTTASDNNLYGAWSDLHMPPATFSDYKYFEPESLMTYENIQNTLAGCDSRALVCLGIKLLAMPVESSIKKRIGINRDTMYLLDRAMAELYKA
jgi:hypothetical protein